MFDCTYKRTNGTDRVHFIEREWKPVPHSAKLGQGVTVKKGKGGSVGGEIHGGYFKYLHTWRGSKNKHHLDSRKGPKQHLNDRENLSLFNFPRFLQQLKSSITMAKHALVSKESN